MYKLLNVSNGWGGGGKEAKGKGKEHGLHQVTQGLLAPCPHPLPSETLDKFEKFILFQNSFSSGQFLVIYISSYWIASLRPVELCEMQT